MHVKQNDNKSDKITSAYLRHSPFKPSNPADFPLSRLCTRDCFVVLIPETEYEWIV